MASSFPLRLDASALRYDKSRRTSASAFWEDAPIILVGASLCLKLLLTSPNMGRFYTTETESFGVFNERTRDTVDDRYIIGLYTK